MLQIFNKYNPNANPSSTDYPNGSGKDESVSGANDGTPLEMDWYNDMLGFSEALLAQGRLTPSGNADTALVSDRLDGFRLAALRVQTACDYTGGDLSLVDVIYVGLDVTTVDYVIDRNSLTRWSVNGTTGTVTADDLNTSTGALSGVSGTFNSVDQSDKLDKAGLELLTGTATFTNSDNNISMTGIGLLGLELGDVVEFEDSALNTGYFTVEVVTDDDNVIFNQAHAGGSTLKSFTDETTTITVNLVSKWNVAPIGLGQSWVNVLSSRSPFVPYTTPANRTMSVSVIGYRSDQINFTMTVDGERVDDYNEPGVQLRSGKVSGTVPPDSLYEISVNINVITYWMELR